MMNKANRAGWRKAFGVLAAFLLLSPAAVGDNEFEVFPFGFADPDTVREIVQVMVDDDEAVILDRRNARLIVRAKETTRDQIRRLIEHLNVPPRNVFVEVDIRDASESWERGASLGVEGGVVVIGRDVSGQITLRPSVTHRTERGRQETRQSLLVASGRQASLRVGQSVPRLQWINRWGVVQGFYEAEIVWEEVGAFLVVQPTVIGDGPYIRIRIIPELSGWVDGQPYRVHYTQVATEVTVSDGQTVSLGGLAGKDEFYRRFLIGVDQSGSQRTLDIRLTPRMAAP